jgi:adenylate cyclase
MDVKRQFLNVILIFLSISGVAQDSTADKIKADLSVSREDTNKVILQLRLSEYYLNSDPEDARRYSLQALALAQRLKFHSGCAHALKNIGSSYFLQGNTLPTLDYYGQALHMYDSIGDLVGKAKLLNNLGSIYYVNGTDDKALEYFFNSLEVAEKIGAKSDIATAYANIASVYANKRATNDKELEFLLKALDISEEIDNKNVIGAVSVNIGEIYFGLQKDDSALFYYYKSLDAYANTINIPYPLRDIGIFYARKGDFKKAIAFHEKSYKMALQFDSKLDMTQTLKSLGDTYFKKGDYLSALSSYKQADSIAGIIPALKELDDGYAGMAATYFGMGDYNKAFIFQKKFSDLADTLNNQMLADKLTSLQRNFEIQTKQSHINLLTKDKKLQELDLNSQKLQKTIISGGLALILIIALIIFRNYLQSAKTNKLLDLQKVQIETLLQNILPAEVAKELQKNGRATPRYFEHASVLFTDFKDFTKHADSLSPQEIVSELNSCFMAFDDIIEKYNLEKIKTIGDSYMCAGGITSANTAHTLNMIQASHDIQLFMNLRNEERTFQGQEPWNLRIGIHVGPVVAGVVGKKKYAYDIWGSTVNIASRMESNGEPGLINISAATYEQIREHYDCVHRGKIFAKNIGEIDMYFVDKKHV